MHPCRIKINISEEKNKWYTLKIAKGFFFNSFYIAKTCLCIEKVPHMLKFLHGTTDYNKGPFFCKSEV